MIIHSIIPTEIIFDEGNIKKEKGIEFKIGDTLVEANEIGDRRYKIKRIISSSPDVYLNSQLKPDMEFEINFSS